MARGGGFSGILGSHGQQARRLLLPRPVKPPSMSVAVKPHQALFRLRPRRRRPSTPPASYPLAAAPRPRPFPAFVLRRRPCSAIPLVQLTSIGGEVAHPLDVIGDHARQLPAGRDG